MFDRDIILSFQAFFSGSLGHSIGVFASRYLIFVLLVFVLVLAWTARRDRRQRHLILDACWAGALAFCLAALLGNVFDRPRPFVTFSEIVQWIPTPLSDTSFPSRHSSIAFALAVALLFVDGYFGVIALAMAIGVAFGRVVTGVHYPTDVLMGGLVGVISVFMVRYLHKKMRSKDVKRGVVDT